MELGFYLPNSNTGADRAGILSVARDVERMGFSSAWVADHMVAPTQVLSHYPFHPEGKYHNAPETPYLEPLTTLAFAAATTEHVKLVVSVLILPYRHPLATAKIAATIDVLSGGRLVLGAGVGWMSEEFEALGHSYFKRRGANTSEQLEIMARAWTGQAFSFSGEFYEFAELMVRPAPLQRPLPIWIGGHTDAALKRTVKYGQAANSNAESPDDVAKIIQRLRQFSEDAGRSHPPELTLRSHVRIAQDVEPFRPGHIIGPTNYIIDTLAAYAELGVTDFGIDSRADGIDVMRANLDSMDPVLDALGRRMASSS
jgi:probable F420-dependent oxidoreductase